LAVIEGYGFAESPAYGLGQDLEYGKDNRAAVGEDIGETCAEAVGFGVSFAVAEAVSFTIDFDLDYSVGEQYGLQERQGCGHGKAK